MDGPIMSDFPNTTDLSADDDLAWVFSWARLEGPEPDEEGFCRVAREAGRVLNMAPERLLSDLDQVLLMEDPSEALERLRRTKILAVALPEVQALFGFHESSNVHHKDLWAHTLQVMVQTAPDVDLRWAALMHDTGKVATRTVGPGRKVTFYRHEAVSAWLMRGLGARLSMPEDRIDRIVFVIAHHARVNAYDRTWSDRALRRLIRDAGSHLEDLIAFASADYTTRRSAETARIRGNLAHLNARIEAIREADARAPSLPKGLGTIVLDALGGDPGPHIGEAIAWLKAEIALGRLPAQADHQVYLAALTARQREDQP
jgi:poly(A) polymerase